MADFHPEEIHRRGKRNFNPLPFSTNKELEKYVIESPDSGDIFMGINFEGDWENDAGKMDLFAYQLRPPAAPRADQSSSFGSVAGWLTGILFPTGVKMQFTKASLGPRLSFTA